LLNAGILAENVLLRRNGLNKLHNMWRKGVVKLCVVFRSRFTRGGYVSPDRHQQNREKGAREA
jgi:hypothetical protein